MAGLWGRQASSGSLSAAQAVIRDLHAVFRCVINLPYVSLYLNKNTSVSGVLFPRPSTGSLLLDSYSSCTLSLNQRTTPV